MVHFYWIIESAKKWIMECVNEHSVFSKSDFGERRSTMRKKNYKLNNRRKIWEKKMERMLISGVALDKDADRISVIGIKDAPGSAFKLFNTLAKKNINVDIIIQSVGREGTKDISFTVAHDNLKEAIELLEEYQEVLGFERVDYNCEVAKLSIVGAGMMSNPGVAAKMFECLYNENVNINMIATSEIRITVLVNSEDAVRAMNAVHDAFGLAEA